MLHTDIRNAAVRAWVSCVYLRFSIVFSEWLFRRYTTGVLYVTRVKKIRSALKYPFVKQSLPRSTANAQTCVLLFSSCVACLRHADFKCSIFLFQGNLWVQPLAPPDRR